MIANVQPTFSNVSGQQFSNSMNIAERERVVALEPDAQINGTSLKAPTEALSATFSEQSKVIEFPRLRPQPISRAYFKTLNQWEGYVIEREGDTFRARIRDLTNPKMPDEEVVFDINEITDEDDISLVEQGAVFYLVVGYNVERKQRVRSAYLYFRRTVVWTKSEIEKLERSAAEFAQLLGSK